MALNYVGVHTLVEVNNKLGKVNFQLYSAVMSVVRGSNMTCYL